MNAYDYTFKSINEVDDINLSDFKGKIIMVVNTASLCGFTYQYDGLQALYDKYSDDGLIVIGVPSNDFGNQESGDNKEIREFCDSSFGITFPLTQKYVVKGKDAHPFFQWIKKEYGFTPRWNFYKVLLDPDGNLVETYNSITKPTSPKITAKIEQFLQKDS